MRGRTKIARSVAWSVSPGLACPGVLEFDGRTFRFQANFWSWLIGGFGGSRDLSIPTECVEALYRSSYLTGISRWWPRPLLVIELKTGHRAMFGVSQFDSWEKLAGGSLPHGNARCADVARRLGRIRTFLWADFAYIAASVALCVGLVSGVGSPAYGLLVGLAATRYGGRFFLLQLGSRRRAKLM